AQVRLQRLSTIQVLQPASLTLLDAGGNVMICTSVRGDAPAPSGLAVTATADTLKTWNNGTSEAANEIVGARTGLSSRLGEAMPGGVVPCLDVGVWPVTTMDEEINLFSSAPGAVDPPSPIAQVRLQNGQPVTLQVFQPASLTLLDAGGNVMS